MSRSTAIRGKDLMLFIGSKAIGLATDCSISINRDVIDAKTKDDGVWADSDAGDIAWEVSANALYAVDNDSYENSFADLYNALVAGTEVAIVVGDVTPSASGKPSSGWSAPTTHTLSGNVIINKLELSGAKGDNASYSFAATGSGTLSITPAPTTSTATE